MKEKVAGIYAIVNTETGEQYIGSSMNILKRQMHHLTNLRKGIHHSWKLQIAWNKYGEQCFDWIVLEEATWKKGTDAEETEQYYLDTFRPEYNEAHRAVNGYGKRPLKEKPVRSPKIIKQKPVKAILTEEQKEIWRLKKKEAQSKGQMGRQFSEKTRRKIGEKSKEYCQNRTVIVQSRPDVKEKIRETKSSIEYKEKVRKSRLGMKYNKHKR